MARNGIKHANVLKMAAKMAKSTKSKVDSTLKSYMDSCKIHAYNNLLQKRIKNPLKDERDINESDPIVNALVGTFRLVSVKGAGLKDGTKKENALGELEGYETFYLKFDDSRKATDEVIRDIERQREEN